jgi:hypothetical protein
MRIDKHGSMDARDIYDYHGQPPETSHVGDSELGLFHGSDIGYNRDYSECSECGGVGRKWIRIKPWRLQNVKCDCKSV